MEPIALDRLTDLDAVLTEDEILARNTVRQFVAEKYLPIIGDHFEHHTFPEELIAETANHHWPHIRRAMGAVLQTVGLRRPVWDEHESILQAINSGDAEARLVEAGQRRPQAA